MQHVRAGAPFARTGALACLVAVLALVCALFVSPGTPAHAATVAQPAVTSCVYANETGGTYKDTLCWLDMSYTDAAGVKKAITTEYRQVGTTATTCTGSGSWVWVNGRQTYIYTYTCTTTMRYDSILGANYGTVTVTGQGQSTIDEATARTQSLARATTNRASALRVSGGLYFGNVTGLPVSVDLSGGAYTLSAKIDISATAGTAAQEARGYGFPTWSGAFLGNNSFYVVPAAIRSSVYPSLYQGPTSAGLGTTTVTLRDIQVLQGSIPFSGYSIVVADAESTDNNETITWTRTGGLGFSWLPNDPTAFAAATTDEARKIAAVGNACSGTDAGNWASLVPLSDTVVCSANHNAAKTGTAMLQAAPPSTGATFSVTQQMKGQGLQGVAFGLLMSRASVTVNVADRILDANGAATTGAFTATVTGSGVTATAQTGATGLTASQALELPVTAGGAQLSFASSPPASYASSYTVAWSCIKRAGSVTATWPTVGGTSASPPSSTDTWFVLQPNVFIDCTVTYTPPYLTLIKTVDNGATGATNTPADFTLTASGSGLSTATVGGAAAVKKPVAVGTYALTEAGPAVGGWQYGYDWRTLSCVAATGAAPTVTTTKDAATTAITAASVAVSTGQAITCTYGNVALAPRLMIGKAANPASGTLVEPGQVVTYTLTFDNTAGTAAAPINHIDHLRDVLDDAVWNASSVRYGTTLSTAPASTTPSGVTATAAGLETSTPTLTLSGSVPRGQVRTVSFTVTVLANTVNASARAAEAAPLRGFVLQNYLTAAGVEPPASCTAPVAGTAATCTIHEVRAPRIVLPLTGGAGWAGPALGGGVVVVLALLAAWWMRRRRSTDS